MDWDAMSPRERDALVAERVMGWSRYGAIARGKRVVLLAKTHGACWHILVRSQRDPGTWEKTDEALTKVDHVPRYTTDIAAAWEVVEKLRASGYVVRSSVYPDGHTYVCLYCEQDEDAVEIEAMGIEGFADRLSLAALRACGVEV